MDPSAVLLGVIGVLITILGVGVPLFVKALRDMRKDHTIDMKELRDGMDNTHNQCDKIKEREIVVETKLDILLDDRGFDIQKMNRKIKEHMDELKDNNKPSIGCIDIKELYRNKEN